MYVQTKRDISRTVKEREREITLLLGANRMSYMPRRLAQELMILSDLEWPFHASRAISTVAELLVIIY